MHYDNEKLMEAIVTYIDGYVEEQNQKGFYSLGVRSTVHGLNEGKIVVSLTVTDSSLKELTHFYIGVDPETYEAERLYPY